MKILFFLRPKVNQNVDYITKMIKHYNIQEELVSRNYLYTKTKIRLKGLRKITQERYDFEGSIISYTEKRRNGKLQFVSLVAKNAEGKIVSQITQDGDRFCAKIAGMKTLGGKHIFDLTFFDTKPQSKNGTIFPNKALQKYLIQEQLNKFCFGLSLR